MKCITTFKINGNRGTCVAQSVVSDFGSGHDLAVSEFKPHVGSVLRGQRLEPALNSVAPSLCSSPTSALSLKNKLLKFF